MTSTAIARSASGCSPASNLDPSRRMETVDLSDRGEGRGGPGRREARDVVAIEIKPGRQVTPADTRGLLSLTGMMRQRRPLALWLAFRGEARRGSTRASRRSRCWRCSGGSPRSRGYMGTRSVLVDVLHDDHL